MKFMGSRERKTLRTKPSFATASKPFDCGTLEFAIFHSNGFMLEFVKEMLEWRDTQ